MIKQDDEEKISLIIPCLDQRKELNKLLSDITKWKLLPNEIIIVDSTKSLINYEIQLSEIKKQNKYKIEDIHVEKAFPGEARNIGLEKSRFDLVAFIDISTEPSIDWLYITYTTLNKNSNSLGILGKTYYKTTNLLAEVIKYATYGENTLSTLPGSMFHKKIFFKVGLFLEFTRSGEDADWIQRVELHQIKLLSNDSILIYNNLDNISIIKLINKWYRNYTYSGQLPYMNNHKNIYFAALLFLFIIGSFNWNWLVAKWDINNYFYIPHVTKISLFFILILYICVRGIIIPNNKGVSLRMIIPLKWIYVSLISIIIDVTKLLAFLSFKFKK